MRVELYLTPQQADELALRDKNVVVIDVLRASTTIITALANGAREVIPVTTVESAVKISGNLFGDVILLGGERNGKIIEGFQLGNSPFEYAEEKVRGKSIIFSTTNGSQALVKARHAKQLLVCGFVNLSAVAGVLKEDLQDLTIICAGNNGMFSMEDSVCAGMLIHAVAGDRDDAALSDGALASLTLHKRFGKNILKMIRNTEHGKYLQEIGFEEDLNACSKVDSVPVVPLLDGNVLKLRREGEKKEVAQPPVPSS